jgi:ribulose-phosphate 3-epimerase
MGGLVAILPDSTKVFSRKSVMVKIAASILAADFARLGEHIRQAEEAGADWIHVDVMDGHFVPNITIGPPVIRAVRKATTLPLDVHLMITEPDRYLDEFVKAGADRLTVHVETCDHMHRTLQYIRELGAKPGVTLNPATPLSTLEEILPLVELVLVMSVNPGFGGQAYIPGSTSKIARLRSLLDGINSQAEIEVDGGINAHTVAEVVGAGATVLVAGSAVFNDQASVRENIQLLRELCGRC